MNNWIDADIVNPPYNKPIEVCYYDIYDDYDGSGEFYDNCCQLVKDTLIYKLNDIDFIHKWKPFRKLETNG